MLVSLDNGPRHLLVLFIGTKTFWLGGIEIENLLRTYEDSQNSSNFHRYSYGSSQDIHALSIDFLWKPMDAVGLFMDIHGLSKDTHGIPIKIWGNVCISIDCPLKDGKKNI